MYTCISVFAWAALPVLLGLLRTFNSNLYMTMSMTFHMIKYSMIHLATYQTKF